MPDLRRRDIPFIVISGRSRDNLPSAFRDAILLSKPVSPSRLHAAIAAACPELAIGLAA